HDRTMWGWADRLGNEGQGRRAVRLERVDDTVEIGVGRRGGDGGDGEVTRRQDRAVLRSSRAIALKVPRRVEPELVAGWTVVNHGEEMAVRPEAVADRDTVPREE